MGTVADSARPCTGYTDPMDTGDMLLTRGVDLFTAPPETRVSCGASYYIAVCLYPRVISKTSQRTLHVLYSTKQIEEGNTKKVHTRAREIDECATDQKTYRENTAPLIAADPTISSAKMSTKTTLAFLTSEHRMLLHIQM